MRGLRLPPYFMVVFLLIAWLLPGCQGLALPTQVIYPSDTPTPTLTTTATIQWFPSTDTPTPGLPTAAIVATVDQRPAVGGLLWSDDFADPSLWQTFVTNSGSAQVDNGMLTLAAPELSANLISLRRAPLPQDYYLEISTFASLCRGKDSYGIAFRADGAYNQYRLLVSCDGHLRLERWRPSEAAVVQNWTLSGQVPPSAPQSLRLGIWLVGSEMRIFVNGVYQFSARDPLLSGAQVGVVLRSTGANATTVNFSNLQIYAIQGYIPSPVPSPTPVVTILPTHAPTFTPVPVP